MPMNQEIKARWTAALRGGEYPQGTSYLRTTDGYCCLGVLCDLAVKDGIITQIAPSRPGNPWEYSGEGQEILLPQVVMDWAGLTENNPHFEPETLPEGVRWDNEPGDVDGDYLIANANDGRTPFTVIADIIDAQF